MKQESLDGGETHKPKAYGTKEGKKMATSLPYVVVCRWL